MKGLVRNGAILVFFFHFSPFGFMLVAGVFNVCPGLNTAIFLITSSYMIYMTGVSAIFKLLYV